MIFLRGVFRQGFVCETLAKGVVGLCEVIRFNANVFWQKYNL